MNNFCTDKCVKEDKVCPKESHCLGAGLKECQQLQSLTLILGNHNCWGDSNNKVRDAGASGLGAGLTEMQQLQQLTLHLESNLVGDAGATGLWS